MNQVLSPDTQRRTKEVPIITSEADLREYAQEQIVCLKEESKRTTPREDRGKGEEFLTTQAYSHAIGTLLQTVLIRLRRGSIQLEAQDAFDVIEQVLRKEVNQEQNFSPEVSKAYLHERITRAIEITRENLMDY